MVAKTTIKQLGSKICVNDENEHLVPALGDGAGVPGDLCAIIAATGKIQGSDVGAIEEFVGILKEDPVTGTETAIPDGTPCSLIVPKSGHRYRIRILDAGTNKEVGNSITFSATPYKAEAAATILTGFLGRLSLPYVDDDTVCEVVWK